MTIKSINGTQVTTLSPLAIEMDSWLTLAGLAPIEIDFIHINDTFPALTSFTHFLHLIVGHTIFLEKSTKRLADYIKTDEQLEDFMNNYYQDRSDDMYKVSGIIDQYCNDNKVSCKLTSEELLKYFTVNPITTLKLYFSHFTEFKAWEIGKMNEKLNSGKLTPSIIFNAIKINPFYDTLSKIVRADWSNELAFEMAI